jgi:hypothetical protein
MKYIEELSLYTKDGYYFRDFNFLNTTKYAIQINPYKINETLSYIRKNTITFIELNSTLFDKEYENLNFLLEIADIVEGIGMNEDNDLNILNQLKKLRELSIFRICKKNTTIVDFNNLPNLEVLSIDYSEKNLKNLSSLKNLKKVLLYYINDDVLQNILQSKLIYDLRIRQSSITSISSLKELTLLENLELYDNRKLTSLEGLGYLKKLSKIEIETCNKIEDLSPLSTSTSLERIILINQKKLISINPLKKINSLKSLKLEDDTNILDGDMSIHQQLEHFSTLPKKHYFPKELMDFIRAERKKIWKSLE